MGSEVLETSCDRSTVFTIHYSYDGRMFSRKSQISNLKRECGGRLRDWRESGGREGVRSFVLLRLHRNSRILGFCVSGKTGFRDSGLQQTISFSDITQGLRLLKLHYESRQT